MKIYADKRRTERDFTVGEEVFLKLQSFRQTSLRPQQNQKFMARFYGPYKILKKIGTVAYQLELPPEDCIHHTFHVSQLKKKLGTNCFPQQGPPLSPNSSDPPRPIKILDRKLVKQNNLPVALVLIQWSDALPEDATWEPYHKLKLRYPDFDSEDTAIAKRRG